MPEIRCGNRALSAGHLCQQTTILLTISLICVIILVEYLFYLGEYLCLK